MDSNGYGYGMQWALLYSEHDDTVEGKTCTVYWPYWLYLIQFSRPQKWNQRNESALNIHFIYILAGAASPGGQNFKMNRPVFKNNSPIQFTCWLTWLAQNVFRVCIFSLKSLRITNECHSKDFGQFWPKIKMGSTVRSGYILIDIHNLSIKREAAPSYVCIQSNEQSVTYGGRCVAGNEDADGFRSCCVGRGCHV